MSLYIAEIENNLEKVFSLPLDVVEQVVDLIVNEKILEYKYDSKNKKVVRK